MCCVLKRVCVRLCKRAFGRAGLRGLRGMRGEEVLLVGCQ